MRKLLAIAALMVASSSSFAQHRLEKLWETDSVTIKGPESVLFDAKTRSLYVSSMGSGSVVRLGLNGKVIKADWATGLNSNKGSAFYKGMFYTAETSGVAMIDAGTGAVVKRIPVEGAGMLNDLAIDAKGIIYVSDTRTGKIHRIENDKVTVYLENIAGANGLLTVDTDLYVVGSAVFKKVDAAKDVTRIADGFESGLDGIVMVDKNEFILSNYRGMMYYVKADGTKDVLLDTRNARIMCNDISYDTNTKTVYAPSFGTNRISAYQLK